MHKAADTRGWKVSRAAWFGLAATLLFAGAVHAMPGGVQGGPQSGPAQVGAPEPLTLGGLAIAGAGLAWARKRRNKQMGERQE